MTINAGVREHQINYSTFIKGLNRSNITLNRKILANLAINEPYSFKALVDEIKVSQNLKTLYKEDMDFIDAVDKKYLVYSEVKPVEKFTHDRIPYISPRSNLPKEISEKIKISL